MDIDQVQQRLIEKNTELNANIEVLSTSNPSRLVQSVESGIGFTPGVDIKDHKKLGKWYENEVAPAVKALRELIILEKSASPVRNKISKLKAEITRLKDRQEDLMNTDPNNGGEKYK